MSIRFFSRNRSVNRIGYGVSAAASSITNAPGFSQSPNPQGGTNYCIVGSNSGSLTFSAGAAALPSTISYLPSKNKEISLKTYAGSVLADVFLVGGGGYGGNAGDLGNSGGGGGGGVVYQPGISLDSTATYSVSAGANDTSTTFGDGTPAYLVAIRGGGGGNRGGSGQPGGSGGGLYEPGGSVGQGLQTQFPNFFSTPQNSTIYGYGNPGSGLSGGSSPFSVPSALLNGTPVAPLGPGGFGQGQGVTNQTGSSGSGRGGSGSIPPGATFITPGAPGCVIIRIYS